ncbi:uncharacterized protein LOC123894363 isoform X2 [Trifolium pratense]|uniref:uncharacterized protein LOC123894363 isoform X2 n=1 Tax=Trifolium pratense TaxID=57577 RepID=UPI001E696344|nr:uncharacterized protein LOC123894363 isoform X2 [Trifolium pratense]
MTRALACCFLLICAHVLCWTSLTQLLETLVEKNYGGSEDLLLGELQFALIAFLSLEAFLRWKSLLSLLFGCTETPFHTRTRLFTKTRRFKELLENCLRWESEQSSAVDGLYFDENDKVSVY